MRAMVSEPLESLRAAIDDIDGEIVALLARRRAVVDALAQHKRAAGLPATDAAREGDLRGRWSERGAAHGLPADVALAVLEAILATSRARVAAVVSGDAAATSGDASGGASG